MQETGLRLFHKRVPLVIVYEGWDAAGKGGNIRRVTEKLDPRGYKVTSIAAPTPSELVIPFSVAFLESPPESGAYQHFWARLVWKGAGGTSGGILFTPGVVTGLPGDQ